MLNVHNKGSMVANGGLALVLKAMDRHQASERVQEHGCAALACIAAGWPFRDKQAVLENGGVDAVVRAMQQYEGSAAVQEHACSFFRKMADRGSDDNTRKEVAAKALEAILHAMRRHAGSAEVQEQGCFALFELADANQDLIASLSGVEAVLHGIEHADRSVVFAAFMALRGLVAPSFDLMFVRRDLYNAKNRDLIVEKGGVELIIDAIVRHRAAAGQRHCVFCPGVELLSALADMPEAAGAIARKGGVDFALWTRATQQFHSAGMRLLRGLAAQDASARVSIAEGDGIDAVVKCLSFNCGSNVNSHALGCSILGYLAPEKLEMIRAKGGVAAVLASMKKFQDNVHVQEAAVEALCRFAGAKDAGTSLEDEAANLFYAAVQKFPDSERIQQWATQYRACSESVHPSIKIQKAPV